MRVALVIGARPNIVKAAALIPAFQAAGIAHTVIHTGQHYSTGLDLAKELRVDVDIHLNSSPELPASHRLGEMVCLLSSVLEQEKFDLVAVVGDCDSTLAGAIAAKKCGLKLAHVEAGLRARDAVQENLNRVLVDHASDYLFCSEPAGKQNLNDENIFGRHVEYVGNVMVDTLFAKLSEARERLWGSERRELYAVLTAHRAENVDDPSVLTDLLHAARPVVNKLPVIFPVHPRTWNTVKQLPEELLHGIQLVDPVGYLDFVKLLSEATVVLTDSGGVQEETTALGVPCLTLREQTERPVTLFDGTNALVGFNAEKVAESLEVILRGEWRKKRGPSLWDGKAAQRIAESLKRLEAE